jgi:hypothetical protein
MLPASRSSVIAPQVLDSPPSRGAQLVAEAVGPFELSVPAALEDAVRRLAQARRRASPPCQIGERDELDRLLDPTLNAGDPEAMVALYEPDVTLIVPPDGQPATGSPAIRHALAGTSALGAAGRIRASSGRRGRAAL